MKVSRGNVGQFGGPDHPHAQAGDPATGRRQVPDLEYRHVPAVTAAPLEVPAGGGARPRGATTSTNVSPTANTALVRPNCPTPGS
jgi:hypothetical protein